MTTDYITCSVQAYFIATVSQFHLEIKKTLLGWYLVSDWSMRCQKNIQSFLQFCNHRFLGEKECSVTKYIKILRNWLYISAASSHFSVKKTSNIRSLLCFGVMEWFSLRHNSIISELLMYFIVILCERDQFQGFLIIFKCLSTLMSYMLQTN